MISDYGVILPLLRQQTLLSRQDFAKAEKYSIVDLP